MALPTRATLEDVGQTCRYLATKPTGATVKAIKTVLGAKYGDARKLAALKAWGLIDEEDDGRWKATGEGRLCAKSEPETAAALQRTIRKTPPYLAVIERAAHRHEDSLSTTDVAAQWHDDFKAEVGESDQHIKDQALCFFQVVEGAGLGNLVLGRRGAPTRLSFNVKGLSEFVGAPAPAQMAKPKTEEEPVAKGTEQEADRVTPDQPESPQQQGFGTSQGIFIAHGKNKKPLEQLKRILDQFKIPYKIAVDEPHLGRPIGSKLRDTMEACNCAILIFTADEEFQDAKGNPVWRPNENVVYELGASGYLYDNRIVIMKEEGVSFASNFQDLGYISFEKDQLDAKAMDVVKELIGFSIVKVST